MDAGINQQNLSNIYQEKSSYYFRFTRTDLIDLLPKSTNFNNVLEIGAAGCDTLLYLKSIGIAKKVTGIELFDFPDSEQKNLKIDRFIKGNIEEIEFTRFNQNEFDLAICGDVLEHLVDPWTTRDKIISWLKPGGVLLTSIPNIREFKTVLKILIKGAFTYQEGGVMDKTHLRFFCKKNIIDLLTTKSLKIKKITTNLAYPTANTKKKSIH